MLELKDKLMPPDSSVPMLPLPKKRLHLPSGLKILTFVLGLIVIGLVLVMLFVWKPWQATVKPSDRVITVNGNATIKATPDEYVFTPTYNFTNASQSTALSQLTTTSNQIVAQLKALGVASSAIQNNSSGYSNGIYAPISSQDNQTTYELDFTITIDDATLAQKVQDYLVSTNPTGSVSPSVQFSAGLEKSLEDKARNQAEQDARANAEQSAKNLGFKIDRVKTVTDNGSDNGTNPCGYGRLCPVIQSNAQASTSSPSLTLQPGQNTLNYSVQVQYYIH